eukprot:CAMPEP_0174703646 /NCGR_PEP_ID=MMETSP1094-20130205/7518_1 /TAXON_ID=156173 /ORGANISM="Chrysochromulina brevifilum, Strain UTEX LB 985" /LENGTH=187 /DNA_ID=CAMNT_0015901593 /DNA_START=1382 /DNA_END=1943 /DNA_ORIENTATION=+
MCATTEASDALLLHVHRRQVRREPGWEAYGRRRGPRAAAIRAGAQRLHVRDGHRLAASGTGDLSSQVALQLPLDVLANAGAAEAVAAIAELIGLAREAACLAQMDAAAARLAAARRRSSGSSSSSISTGASAFPVGGWNGAAVSSSSSNSRTGAAASPATGCSSSSSSRFMIEVLPLLMAVRALRSA